MESSFLSGNIRAPWGRRVGESLTLRIAVLLAVVVFSTSCLAWAAFRYESYTGLICLLTAASVCFGTGCFMLVFTAISGAATPQASHLGFVQVGLGLVFRMGVPLLLCAIVAIQGGQSLAQSLARYLLILYPLVLFTETWLTVKQRAHLDMRGGLPSCRVAVGGRRETTRPTAVANGRNQTGESS